MIESNGKKVAAVLCVASCFPVVATVYAMETDPGWHGDKYVNEDATIAKGWQEIEGKSYYFEEDGTVDKETTENGVVASVSVDITGDVEQVVEDSTTEVVEEVQVEIDEQKAAEEQAALEAAQKAAEEQAALEAAQKAAEEQAALEQAQQEQVVVPEQEPVQEVVTPVQPTTPVVEEEQVVVEETKPVTQKPDEQKPVAQKPAEQKPAVQKPAAQQPVQQTPAAPVNQYADLNNRIAESAKSLVGVTDGQWCTQVVQQALAGAGVQDAYQLWPDQYAGVYGNYTNTPQAGNLVYYYNGGRGVDHIAVYIGNGQAVHGNYGGGSEMGKTVVASVYINGGAPQYIQVNR